MIQFFVFKQRKDPYAQFNKFCDSYQLSGDSFMKKDGTNLFLVVNVYFTDTSELDKITVLTQGRGKLLFLPEKGGG